MSVYDSMHQQTKINMGIMGITQIIIMMMVIETN